MDDLLRRQWALLRGWLADNDVLAARDRRRAAGWTLGDLVAHLGFGLAMVPESKAAPSGTAPISLARYIVQYQPAAPVTAEKTRELAAAWPTTCSEALTRPQPRCGRPWTWVSRRS